ncbi:MAG TPA: P-loop NTPase fold protein [Anaerolineales bacterium]|nr:P-loop NTPase fold protein [Anaerolineales bacterium]
MSVKNIALCIQKGCLLLRRHFLSGVWWQGSALGLAITYFSIIYKLNDKIKVRLEDGLGPFIIISIISVFSGLFWFGWLVSKDFEKYKKFLSILIYSSLIASIIFWAVKPFNFFSLLISLVFLLAISLMCVYSHFKSNKKKKVSIPKPDINDILGRTGIVNKISQLLTTPENIYRVIGFAGKWGSGKSYVTQQVKISVSQPEKKIFWVEFNPQTVSKTMENSFERLFESLYKTIISSIPDSDIYLPSEEFSVFLKLLEKIPFPKEIFNALVSGWLQEREKADDIFHKLTKLMENIAQLIIIVDDVEKLQADEIINIFKLIEAYQGIPKIKFLIVYDWEDIKNKLVEAKVIDTEKYPRRYLDYIEILPPGEKTSPSNHLFSYTQSKFPDDKEFIESSHFQNLEQLLETNTITIGGALKIQNHIEHKLEKQRNTHPFDLAVLTIVEHLYPHLYYLISQHGIALTTKYRIRDVKTNLKRLKSKHKISRWEVEWLKLLFVSIDLNDDDDLPRDDGKSIREIAQRELGIERSECFNSYFIPNP